MPEAFLGEIRVIAGASAPEGWMFCNGQMLKVKEYEPLWSVIRNRFGGDDQTTFALPDLQGRAPLGQRVVPGLTERKVGEKAGEAQVALTQSEMPSHHHVPSGIADTGTNSSDPTGRLWAEGVPGGRQKIQPNLYSPTPNTAMNGAALSPTGGNQSHNNMQPYLSLSFIICVKDGHYPIRPESNDPK